MKHRSVIAYVIVAAALFAAPQLSHDLENLGSALGSRLNVGLMRTFLSLPSDEGAAGRVGAPLPAETQLATCPKQRQASKPTKAAPARAEAGAAEASGEELAMMMIEPPPVTDPPHKALVEVAMIIPPDSGVEPPAFARAAADASAVRLGEAQTRRLAEQVRSTRFVATRFEGKGVEWRSANDALRNLEVSLPGAYEFRIERVGSKTKVLKVRRGATPCCAPPAPRAPRPVGMDAAAAVALPLPSLGMLAAFVGE